MKTPDMTGKAAEIDDPELLFAPIGYRTYLMHRDGPNGFPRYQNFIDAELKRLGELDEKVGPGAAR